MNWMADNCGLSLIFSAVSIDRSTVELKVTQTNQINKQKISGSLLGKCSIKQFVVTYALGKAR